MLNEIRQQALEIGGRLPWEITPKVARESYFGALRQSDIPYLGWHHRERPAALHKLSFDALYLLARASLPCTVAFTMHQYVSSSLAAVSLLLDSGRRCKVEELLQQLKSRQQLLGIAEFGDHLRPPGQNFEPLLIESDETGYCITGKRSLVSLTDEADRLALVGRFQERLTFLLVDFKDNPKIEIQEPVLQASARLTQTRPVKLEGATFTEADLLCDDEKLTVFLCTYTTAWFQALIAATYLGAASRAMEEVRAFSREVHLPEGGPPLAELDGFVVDFGRLAIKLRAGLALASSFGPALARVHRLAQSGDDRSLTEGVDELVELSSLIKYEATARAQEVVSACRGLIGTRSLSEGHPLEQLTQLISIGPLHPIIPAKFERSSGRSHLGEEPFKGLFHHL